MEALQRFSHVGQLIAVSEVALSCVSALGLCWLSVVEHRRSVRPSTLATSYLLASVLFETAWVAAPNLSGCSIGQTFFGLVIGQICVKVALLTLELKGKEAILYPSHQGLAPEDTAGILRNAVFWWINPILARGAKAILALEDLPPVTQSLSSDALWESMSRAWLPKCEYRRPLISCAAGMADDSEQHLLRATWHCQWPWCGVSRRRCWARFSRAFCS